MWSAYTLLFIVVAALGACNVERVPDGREPPKPSDRLVPDLEPGERVGRPLPPAAATPTASPLPAALEARRVAAVERLRQGDVAGGLAALDALWREAGPSYAIANDRAVAHALAGDWGKALAAADEALALFDGVEAGANKVEALLATGERTAASDLAGQLTERFPASALGFYALGSAQVALGDMLGARLSFDAALDRSPDDFASLLGVLACAAADPEAPELDELGEELLKRSPDDPHVLYLLGSGKEMRAEQDLAKGLYRRAVAAADKRGVALPWAHWNLARLLEETIDIHAARPHYQKFLDSAPRSALVARQEAEKKLGKTPEVMRP